MILRLSGHNFHYESENMCRVFFPNEKITVQKNFEGSDNIIVETQLENDNEKFNVRVNSLAFGKSAGVCLPVSAESGSVEEACELAIAKGIFLTLSEICGYVPEWGLLTGVRPSKLMRSLIVQLGKLGAENYFTERLLVSREKTQLTQTVAENEREIIGRAHPNAFSLYVSIPFCPSRCSYCSFVSHSITGQNAKKLLPKYVERLCDEIAETGKISKELNLKAESVYIGGGTPGILDPWALEKLFEAIKTSFDLNGCSEFTLEAGRPDTITREKLKVIKENGFNRISINPQTFNDEVLKAVGRHHSAKETLAAFELARETGFECINMDFIAGLPQESFESFCQSVEQALLCGPENITVHTLALKRASELASASEVFGRSETVKQMLGFCAKMLNGTGYIPYYMYRQSKCIGNLENVGWSKKGFECAYNIYMMEECHTVLACGAGAVTKLKQQGGTYLERIFNFKYPYEYVSRFEEMLERKNRIKDFYSSYNNFSR